MSEAARAPQSLTLVDSHCHLDDSDFDADREAVIERALAAGVKTILTIGGGRGPQELAASIAIARSRGGIYAAVGIHPHEAEHVEPRHYDALRAAAQEKKVLALGEVGLDYHYDHSPREVQKQVFARQLEVAQEARLPIVIHCRNAWHDLQAIIRESWAVTGLGGILHCFTGNEDDARIFLDWGFMISFAGNITFKKAESLREVARKIPLDCLLTETDSPYLAPVPHRGKRNEPAFVRDVARELAWLHGLDEAEMGALTAANFAHFFRLR